MIIAKTILNYRQTLTSRQAAANSERKRVAKSQRLYRKKKKVVLLAKRKGATRASSQKLNSQQGDGWMYLATAHVICNIGMLIFGVMAKQVENGDFYYYYFYYYYYYYY